MSSTFTQYREKEKSKNWYIILSDMKLLDKNYWHLKSTTIVRDNLMNEPRYTGYCEDELCLPRTTSSPDRWPRTKFNGEQFVCPKCGWISKFPIGFIIEYKRKWNLK